ncbi:uncharacterized protein LOC111896073 [Lactuca sativa]|uniref:uncharacterized protein LOC111896073 n=1 Tax=Lactuca sativa TaxID=4236 RepID=UPI0022AFA7B4|nr:uncharacterized protein LOC111896073 [Lactuca sativa]
MADSLLSSITTFHTTKIIVTDPSKFSFIGSIPEAMLSRISVSSNVLQQYRKHPSVGPRELTPAMLRSTEEADKPAKRGKKPETRKEGPVNKPTKGQTPKKRKSDKPATSQAQLKKQKKPARILILQSSSVSDSEYVPPKHKTAPHSESENESSDEEASGRGDTPPRSPTPEISVRSSPPSPQPISIPVSIPPISPINSSQPFTTIPIPTPIFTDTTTTTTTTKPDFTVPNPPVTEPPVTTEPPPSSKPLSPTPSTETTPILGSEDLEFDSTYFSPFQVQSNDDDDEPVTKRHLKAVNDNLDQLLLSSSYGAYSDVALKALFSSVVAEYSATLSAAAKAIEASTSQCQQASLAVDASTKECKDATTKVDKLVSEAHLFLDSLQVVAAKKAQIVNASVENLQKSLQSERSNLEAARQAIEEANEMLHANVNERLTQLEVDLAMENRIMDELDRRTTQLKLETHKLRTANAEIDNLKSEREVIRSFAADVHSILLHLIEAHDLIITITVRRHLADKLKPALDVFSRIEGVSVTGVQPKQVGEQVSKQPPASESKASAEPKGNEASVSNKDKKN